MVGVFTMLGLLGLLGGGTTFIWIFTANPAVAQYYIGILDSLFTTILVSLVVLASAKILSN